MSTNQNNSDNKFMRLEFKKASEHFGSTIEIPSVGCIIVKNGSIVSSGVTSITVDMTGGSGGYNGTNTTCYGKGGRVQTTLTVSAGSTLYIYVGGSGSGVTGGYNLSLIHI